MINNVISVHDIITSSIFTKSNINQMCKNIALATPVIRNFVKLKKNGIQLNDFMTSLSVQSKPRSRKMSVKY